jgi:hypothetical protein
MQCGQGIHHYCHTQLLLELQLQVPLKAKTQFLQVIIKLYLWSYMVSMQYLDFQSSYPNIRK